MMTGLKPNLQYLRRFGEKCFVHVPKRFRGKLDDKAVEGVILGIEEKHYLILIPATKKIIRSVHVTFPKNSASTDILRNPTDIENTDNDNESDSDSDDSTICENEPNSDHDFEQSSINVNNDPNNDDPPNDDIENANENTDDNVNDPTHRRARPTSRIPVSERTICMEKNNIESS